MSYAKNTPAIVGPKPYNQKPDSAKKLGSEVSNSFNEAEPKLDVKSIKGTEILKMCDALIGSFCGFSYLSIFLEITNTITLNLLNVHFSVKF